MMKQSSISHTVPLITFRSIKLTQIVGFPYMQRQNFGRKEKKKKNEKSYKKNTTIHQKKNFGSLFTKKKKKEISIAEKKRLENHNPKKYLSWQLYKQNNQKLRKTTTNKAFEKKKTRDTTIKKVYHLGIEFIIIPIRQPNLLKRKGKGKNKKPVIQQLIKFANSYIKKKVCKFGIEINQHNQKVYSNKPTKFINKKNASHKHPRRI